MSALPDHLRHRLKTADVEPIDIALADWAWRHGGGAGGAMALALARHAVGRGHTCVHLDDAEAALGPAAAPLLTEHREALAENPLVADATTLAAEESAPRPLVIDAGRLYLQRYHDHERRLARAIGERLAQPAATAPGTESEGEAADTTDWQAVAEWVARRHRFSVISGGPGTGKTFTIVRLMLALIDDALASSTQPPVFRLAAPTGKAAARMKAAVDQGLAVLEPPPEVRAHLPAAATTLHRLLRLSPVSTRPGHDRERPLAADVVIVDEASMVDLPLMTRLVEALPPTARLVLLGDRYQLASVESGAVLADLCAPAGVNAFSPAQVAAAGALLADHAPTPAPHPLGDHVVTLQTGRRFSGDSGIGRLAGAINAGDIGAVKAALNPDANSDANSDAGADPGVTTTPDLGESSIAALVERMAAACAPLHTAHSVEAALDALDRVRLLTATRIGPVGSEALNARIAAALAAQFGFDPTSPWYAGRPVMVTRNDPRAGLFNGDTGVVRLDDDGRPGIWFRTEAGLRRFRPSACPAHVTVYAMTIHKSQGSEFDQVDLVLPPAGSRTLSRELLYTGVTRARDRLHLVATPDALTEAVERTSQRVSGLAERIAAIGAL